MRTPLALLLLALTVAPAAAGKIETVAGSGQAGYAGDGGPAVKAHFNQPFHCDRDSKGSLYVADAFNHCIRKVNLKSGVITTIAGTGKKGYTGDGGPAVKATMNEPYAVAVDAGGDLYIVDRLNAVIRKVEGRTGVITTVAGDGKMGYGGDGGKAVRARMVEPNDCCLDGRGGLLIADVGDWRIRRLDLKTGLIATFAGTGKPQGRLDRSRNGDGGPAFKAVLIGSRAVCVDGKGNTYICEREGNAVRKVDPRGIIHTVAGTGKAGSSGDGGKALKATFRGPKGIRCDRQGNVYVVDTENHAIRKIDVKTGTVITVAGGRKGTKGDGGEATKAGLDRPHGCVVDARGNLYIADSGNHRVRRVRPRQAEPRSTRIKRRQDAFRVIVEVAPVDIGRRAHDGMPADVHLAAADHARDRRLDLASLQIVRWDNGAGKALSGPLPLRWYDDAIPYDFPECEQNASSTDGLHLQFVTHPRWGDFYNLLGDGKGGRLAWTHTQEGKKPAYYAVSFRLLPKGKVPEAMPPRGLVGDGSHRCAPLGHTSTGMIHSRVTVADWNGDGLPDLLIGGARGQVVCYPNVGTRTQPKFTYGRMVTTADGKPLDVGWSAAPLAVDWDGDGVTDLLVGAERNRILFYRNLGTNKAPRLVNKGFVKIDGKPLMLPIAPVPKSPRGVYPLDYYPVLEAVDWNGDGRIDLLAGGYITGRVYFYENVGKEADGTPKLKYRGPLLADGKPLNVGDWAAAPCAADFDGDGDLDLIVGNMPLSAGGGDSTDAEHFLRYYENVGTHKQPRLVERPFPRVGKFPSACLATPRAVDVNGDGLLDLVVSAGENVYIFLNVGTKKKPLFAVHDKPLPSLWGSAPLPTFGIQFVDWDGDGKKDILTGLTIYRNQGDGDYQPLALLPTGNRIDHGPARGDGWTFTQLADLDGDGRLDLLYGTHEGNIWLHRNLGGKPARYDETGVKLRTTDGKPIKVGPLPGRKMDFDVLQGARTTFTVADFDGDGRLDLVVGDTFGKVRYYRNVGTRKKPLFAAPVQIGDVKIRMIPYAADWDGDGRVDVVGSVASGEIVLYRNLGKGRFAAARPIRVPAVPYSPFAAVVDWNDDGDPDLVVGTAYGYFCWFERSFLEHGYARATVLKAGPRKAEAPVKRPASCEEKVSEPFELLKCPNTFPSSRKQCRNVGKVVTTSAGAASATVGNSVAGSAGVTCR